MKRVPLSPTLAVGGLALILALGGTGYAVAQDGSDGGGHSTHAAKPEPKQKAKRGKRGRPGPVGPQGATGPAGPAGAPGAAGAAGVVAAREFTQTVDKSVPAGGTTLTNFTVATFTGPAVLSATIALDSSSTVVSLQTCVLVEGSVAVGRSRHTISYTSTGSHLDAHTVVGSVSGAGTHSVALGCNMVSGAGGSTGVPFTGIDAKIEVTPAVSVSSTVSNP